MSDYASSLPTRTENPGDIAAKIVDGTITTQALAIDSSGKVTSKLNDGAGNSVTSQTNGAQQALDVGVNVAGVQVDPRSIRALTSADVVTSNQGTANTATNGWPVKPTDGTNSQSFTAAGEAKVQVTELLTEDHNYGTVGAQTLRTVANLAITNAAVSATNPVPVSVVSTALGTEVNDYNTAAAIAANATSNHDYAITSGKTFKGRLFHASASGKLKVEIQISPDGTTFTSKWVGFNSTSNPNIDIQLDNLTVSETGAGSKIRIIRTNIDKASMDVYSTISGSEV